jgi:ATP-dependent Clp endopeptidase proteolytic subunit ClpP
LLLWEARQGFLWLAEAGLTQYGLEPYFKMRGFAMATKKAKKVKPAPYNMDRCIIISGEINPDTTLHVMEKLAELLRVNPTDPIDIVLDSMGGDLYAMFSIHDLMRSCAVTIRTFAIGQCMSCATLLLAAGDERYIYPNAFLMLHEPYYSTANDLKAGEIKADMQHNQVLSKRFFELYAKYTGQSAQEWAGYVEGRSVYLNSREACDMGFCDDIVPIS